MLSSEIKFYIYQGKAHIFGGFTGDDYHNPLASVEVCKQIYSISGACNVWLQFVS